jgi:hypothetical protein
MDHISEQQMAQQLAPTSGPGREAAEAERRAGREQAILDRASVEQRRYGDTALATLATAWLQARHEASGADGLRPEEAAELRLLTSMADRMAHQAGVNALGRLAGNG